MLLSALLVLGACAEGLANTLPKIELGSPDDLLAKKGATTDGLIIQLKSNAKLGKRAEGSHARFYRRAALAKLEYTVRTEFTNEALFHGVSINLKQNKTMDEVNAIIKDMPEVQAVWPLLKVPKPGPAPGTGNVTETVNAQARTAASNQVGPADETSKLPRIEGADVTSTHRMAGVDKLHAEGVKGKGVKVGVIDTGVDYRHPALGGGFGAGFKIAGGYSLMDDEWTSYSGRAPIEGSDPLATCSNNAHGTHVSGIIGMQDAGDQGFAGLNGVAPEASLYMYKVFSCLEDTTPFDVIMKAMAKAAEDKMDVISMSLGALNLFETLSPYPALVDAINKMGIGIVVSNGNAGELGLYAESTPADSKGVIAVGSITNDAFPVMYRAKDSNGKCFQYGSVWPLDAPELQIIYHGDICTYNAWQATGAAVRKIGADKVMVIAELSDRCPLGTQMSGASAFGVKFLLGFTSESLDPSPFGKDIEIQVPFPSVATVVVQPRIGRKLVANFQNDASYKLRFAKRTTASGLKMETGGTMSNFSSFGTSWDTLAVKPTLSAPGGKILSTWTLGTSAGYGIISGTSMAAPFVAGCWALVKSKFPSMPAAEIASLLQSSSSPVSYAYDKSILSTVAHQGSGMVNVYNAISSMTQISPSELSLGDIDDFAGKPQTIKITNKGSAAKTFTVSHQGAGYAELFPYPDLLPPNNWGFYGQPQYAIYGSSNFSVQSITVEAGKTVELQVYISAPELSKPQIRKTPLMSGFIQLKSSSETHTIPYLGVPYSRQNEPGFDTTPYPYTDSNGQTQTAPNPYVYCATCVGGKLNTGFDTYNGTDWFFPGVWFNILTGIKHFQINIMPADIKFNATHHGGDPAPGSGYEYMKPSVTPHDEWMGMPSYGWIADSSQYNNYAPREVTANYPPFQAVGVFRWGAAYFHTPDPDGTVFQYLPNGDYRFLMSLLKEGSDYDDLSQWETYLGPVMRLVGDNY